MLQTRRRSPDPIKNVSTIGIGWWIWSYKRSISLRTDSLPHIWTGCENGCRWPKLTGRVVQIHFYENCTLYLVTPFVLMVVSVPQNLHKWTDLTLYFSANKKILQSKLGAKSYFRLKSVEFQQNPWDLIRSQHRNARKMFKSFDFQKICYRICANFFYASK